MSKKQRDSLHAEVQKQLQQQQQGSEPVATAYSLGMANGQLKLAPSPDLLEASACSTTLLNGQARLGQSPNETATLAYSNGLAKAQGLLSEDLRTPFAKEYSPERIKMEGRGSVYYTLEMQASPELSHMEISGVKRAVESEIGGEGLDFYTTPTFTSLLESPNSSLTEIGECTP